MPAHLAVADTSISTPPRRTSAQVLFGAVAGLLAGAKAGFVLAGCLRGRGIVGRGHELVTILRADVISFSILHDPALSTIALKASRGKPCVEPSCFSADMGILLSREPISNG